ncbi:MAG: hypothetical protein D6689_03575 [Deltaproteobacteria bacterium]|nr:MAG: hypothetical protein D6689_03575 [Deltaproteobacteria bacterium]
MGCAVGLALLACGDPDPVTVVVVTVRARPAVTRLARLAVTVRNATAAVSEQFDLEGRAPPVTFTVTPTGRAGDLTVEVDGLDGEGALRGRGATTVAIVPDGRADADVLLEPTDFPINDAIAGTQRLTFDPNLSGRQLAPLADGFVATYVNDCATLGRCDVLARRFDATGTPAVNDTTMDDGEFIANRTDEFTAVPAVASNGTTALIAWQTSDAIKAVAITDRGAHVSAFETVVSTGGQSPRAPAVTALATGEYLVAWIESDGDGGAFVRGRLLSSQGQPVTNTVTGDDLDFAVSGPESGRADLPHVAGGPTGRSFVAVWTQADDFFAPANVRARFFRDDGTPASVGNARITTFADGDAFAPKVVALSADTALIAYNVRTGDDPRLAAGALVIGRYAAPNGAAVGGAIIHPFDIQPAFNSTAPALARRGDGVVGAVWSQCGADGDGQGCGVWFRALDPTGLPIGAPAIANTTLPGDQDGPSIAALADAFALAWSDASMAPPDTDGGGVRGRIVYADAETTDGHLGARCGRADDAPCDDGLACAAGADGAPRCWVACDPAAAVPCPLGGACTTAGDTAVCLY